MIGFDELMRALSFIGRLEEIMDFLGHGPLHRFHIPQGCGWSGYQIECLLRGYGIPVYGRGFASDCLFFAVPQSQAHFADYHLRRLGVPIAGSTLELQKAAARDDGPDDEPPYWRDSSRRREPAAAQKDAWLDDLMSLLTEK